MKMYRFVNVQQHKSRTKLRNYHQLLLYFVKTIQSNININANANADNVTATIKAVTFNVVNQVAPSSGEINTCCHYSGNSRSFVVSHASSTVHTTCLQL